MIQRKKLASEIETAFFLVQWVKRGAKKAGKVSHISLKAKANSFLLGEKKG